MAAVVNLGAHANPLTLTLTLTLTVPGAAVLEGTSLAAWARANAPEWLTPQQQEDYVALFLLAAEMYQEWDAEAGEGSNMMDLFDIDEEDEGYGGDAEDGAEAAASA